MFTPTASLSRLLVPRARACPEGLVCRFVTNVLHVHIALTHIEHIEHTDNDDDNDDISKYIKYTRIRMRMGTCALAHTGRSTANDVVDFDFVDWDRCACLCGGRRRRHRSDRRQSVE